MNCVIKSNIRLKSNIITKDKWERDKISYLPFELLPNEYRDPSLRLKLTLKQRDRCDAILFLGKNKREVKTRIWQEKKCFANCKNCEYKNICY